MQTAMGFMYPLPNMIRPKDVNSRKSSLFEEKNGFSLKMREICRRITWSSFFEAKSSSRALLGLGRQIEYVGLDAKISVHGEDRRRFFKYCIHALVVS